MAERDPFGRLPDENPLAGLGSLSDGSDGHATAEPVAARWEAFEQTSAEPAQQQPARSAARAEAVAAGERAAAQAGVDPAHVAAIVRRVMRVVRIGVTIAILVVVGLVVLGVAVSGDDEPATSTEFAPEKVPALPAAPPPGPPSRARASRPWACSRARCCCAATSRRRCGGWRRAASGSCASCGSRPSASNLQLVTREGKLRNAQVRPGGETQTLSLSGSGFAGLPTMRFADVNAGAPARLARGAAERSKRPVSQVEYVALLGVGPRATWTVVMRNGGQFVGDARGRITRRVG